MLVQQKIFELGCQSGKPLKPTDELLLVVNDKLTDKRVRSMFKTYSNSESNKDYTQLKDCIRGWSILSTFELKNYELVKDNIRVSFFNNDTKEMIVITNVRNPIWQLDDRYIGESEYENYMSLITPTSDSTSSSSTIDEKVTLDVSTSSTTKDDSLNESIDKQIASAIVARVDEGMKFDDATNEVMKSLELNDERKKRIIEKAKSLVDKPTESVIKEVDKLVESSEEYESERKSLIDKGYEEFVNGDNRFFFKDGEKHQYLVKLSEEGYDTINVTEKSRDEKTVTFEFDEDGKKSLKLYILDKKLVFN